MYVYLDVDQQMVLNINRLNREALAGGARSASPSGRGLQDERSRATVFDFVGSPIDPATARPTAAKIANPDGLVPGMFAQAPGHEPILQGPLVPHRRCGTRGGQKTCVRRDRQNPPKCPETRPARWIVGVKEALLR
jgi:hypothetical protein